MLTVTQIRALKPAPKPYKVADVDGLFLLVQPSGALLWRFRFRTHGIEKKLSLGEFPNISLQQARRLREEAHAKLVDGIDPVEEKRQRKLVLGIAARTTFRLVAEEYIQKSEREGRSPATIKKARWFLELLDRDIGERILRRRSGFALSRAGSFGTDLQHCVPIETQRTYCEAR